MKEVDQRGAKKVEEREMEGLVMKEPKCEIRKEGN